MSALALQKEDFSVSSFRYNPDEPEDTLRQLIMGNHALSFKQVSYQLQHYGCHVSEDTVRRWCHKNQPIPAKYLGALYLALGRYSQIISATLEGTDIRIFREIPLEVRRSPIRLFQETVILFGDIYKNFSKVVRREKLTKEELRALREEVDQLKETLDEIVEAAEQEAGGKS